jgi:hypothetical protein
LTIEVEAQMGECRYCGGTTDLRRRERGFECAECRRERLEYSDLMLADDDRDADESELRHRLRGVASAE